MTGVEFFPFESAKDDGVWLRNFDGSFVAGHETGGKAVRVMGPKGFATAIVDADLEVTASRLAYALECVQ